MVLGVGGLDVNGFDVDGLNVSVALSVTHSWHLLHVIGYDSSLEITLEAICSHFFS